MNVKSFEYKYKKYFLLTEGRDDINRTFKSVTITDGDCAWKIQDVSFQEGGCWSGIKEALCEQKLNQVKELKADLQNESDLQLQWTWNSSEGSNEKEELSESIILKSCEKQSSILNMLDVLVNSFQAVKVVEDQVDKELSQYKQVAQALEQTERQMQEMYQRFAVILNEKKRQVRYFAEKAGMIDDKGVYQIPEDEKEQIPQESIPEETSPEKDDEVQREDSPNREIQDIMEMDTQPIQDEVMVEQQPQEEVQINEEIEQQQQEQKQQEDEPMKPVIDIVKVVKKGSSKRGRGKRR
eukprot:TRINITY_DN10887_c0_g2_i1.p2 TRINITY_DN10887_c0_g2~~TRINITY_DN10887_c0_g2_i1.p2  ORF type:complete len:296 (+),score=60.34 TRINITY_DN10887_c0_g2_i1:66-953(+)